MTEGCGRAARNGLLALTMLGVAVLVGGQERDKPAGVGDVPTAEPAGASAPKSAGSPVVVFFFHRTRRCQSCQRIEALASSAIQAGFAGPLREGRLEWRAMAFDAPGGKRYVQKYVLFTSSVVLVEMEKGEGARWKKLDDVWTLLGDERRFTEYVQREVAAFLGEQ